MYMIQNGPNWWIDQLARFPVGQIEIRSRTGALSNTYLRNPLDTSDTAQSNNVVISDYEEEGEVPQLRTNQERGISAVDDIGAEIESGHSSGGASDENPSDKAFQESLKGDMLKDPAAAFAATSPSQDRLGLLALLKN